MRTDLTESPIRIANGAEGIAAILHETSSGALNVKPRTGLLMVHSQGACKDGHKRSFVELARRLTPLGIPVLRFDLLGEGESEELSEDPYLHWRGMQPAVDFFWKAMALDRLIALGDCFGGLLAAYYAQLEPRIERAVIWNIAQMNWTPDLLEGYAQSLPVTRTNISSRLLNRARQTPALWTPLSILRRLGRTLRQLLPAKPDTPGNRLGTQARKMRRIPRRRVPITVIHAPSAPNAEQAIAVAEFVFDKLEMDAEHVRIAGVPFSGKWKSDAYAVVLNTLAAVEGAGA